MKGVTVATSGETAKATTDNNAVEVFAADTTKACASIMIINEGTVAGFYRIGSGDWCRLPAGVAVPRDDLNLGQVPKLEVKRVENGTDLAGIYAYATGG